MVSNKVALGLFLSFSLAMGYQTIKQSNSDNVIKEPILQRISDNNKKLVTEKDLDDMKTKKIQKNQKIANYISTKYDIPINNAEKIVYATFEESIKKNLEPTLVLSLIDNESRFQQHIKSPVGAVGLTQVMPKYHKEKIDELRKNEGTDIFSITGNIKVGTQILREYLNQAGGNLKKALQMYNGSVGDSKQRYSNQILSKMREYAKI